MSKPRRKSSPPRRREAARGPVSQLAVRRVPGADAWELVHPPCARARREDIDEVQRMIDAGETEIALDELRWLLNGCSDCVAAHRLLGELALLAGDLHLARGHFGYAYEIGAAAIDRARVAGPLPYARPANQDFLESAKGLAHCLVELGKRDLARDVLQRLLRWDASDPLGVAPLLAAAEASS